MKSSKKRQVTAAFFAAAALGGVAHAAPVLNMNDLVGSKTTSESTTETINNVATPVVQPMVPRVRPVPVPDTAKALEEQYRAVSQPQYVVNTNNASTTYTDHCARTIYYTISSC